ncbi:263_t:CDS:1, partial [Racocetra persica]
KSVMRKTNTKKKANTVPVESDISEHLDDLLKSKKLQKSYTTKDKVDL